MTGKTIFRRISGFGMGIKGSEGLAVSVECAVRFTAALVLSAANVADGRSPFAAGFVAAAPPGVRSLAALVGAVLGHFLFGTFETALKYSAICLLTAACVMAFRDTEIFKYTWFRPLAAGAMAACTGFVYVYDAGWALGAVAAFVCETLSIALLAGVYTAALSPWRAGIDRSAEVKRNTSVLLMLATAASALVPLRLFGTMYVGRAAASLLVMLPSFACGAAGGALCGAVFGAMMDISSGTFFFAAAFALAGAVSALFRKRGRLSFVLVYIISMTAAALCMWENLNDGAVFYEVFASSVLFMILPPSVMTRVGGFFPAPVSGYGAMLSRECVRRRTEAAADAFRELSDIAGVRTESGVNDNSTATVFDRAAERVCRKCSRSSECWQTGYQTTVGVFNDLTGRMLAEGAVSMADFPEFFAEKCEHLPQLASAITDELRAQTVRLQYKSRVSESRGAAAGQYADVSEILASIADDLGGDIKFEPDTERKLVKYLRTMDIDASAAVFRSRSGRLRAELTGLSLGRLRRDEKYLDKLSAVIGTRMCTTEEGLASGRLELFEAEPMSVTIGTASMKRRGELRNGDRTSYFKTDDGGMCIMLSDGMGTGTDAAKYSEAALGILEKLLRAGTPPQNALHLLNDLMLLKSDGDTGNATADIMMIDLFTGMADVYKFGAAPSYVVSDGSVRKMTQRGLVPPLGTFSDRSPEHCRTKLFPGSLVVAASDGVTRGLDDSWLCELLADTCEREAKTVARLVIDRAAEKFGKGDDMTVLAVRVEERK